MRENEIRNGTPRKNENTSDYVEVRVGYLIFAALICVLGYGGYVTVDAGHTGVIKRFGAVQKQTFAPGFHIKIPFVESVDEIDTRIGSYDAKAAAASRDLQTVQTQISIQYALSASLVATMINDLGSRQKLADTIIAKAIQESVKANTAQFNAAELITKRGEVKTAIRHSITIYVVEALKDRGLSNLVQIANIGITDFEFSTEFNQAIERKVKAEQDALRAENEKRQKIVEAEAIAQVVKLQADAAAYKTEAEAKARAQAITQEGKALAANPSVIKLRIAEKWDGVLPRVNGGGVLPLLNMNSSEVMGR